MLIQVPKAKVEVPSIEVVAQILEELDYKPLGPWGKPKENPGKTA